jgi:hypothetical protein
MKGAGLLRADKFGQPASIDRDGNERLAAEAGHYGVGTNAVFVEFDLNEAKANAAMTPMGSCPFWTACKQADNGVEPCSSSRARTRTRSPREALWEAYHRRSLAFSSLTSPRKSPSW